MISDLRSAFRHLVKSPGFSAVAIATLALALGVNSAIFSLVNGLVLKPTMSREPDRIVSVFTAKQSSDRDYRQFSHREFNLLRESDGPFTEATAYTFAMVGTGERDTMRRSLTFIVAENFFHFAGTEPAIGRFFRPEETAPNADIPVVVASHALWRRLGGREDFVGSTLRVNGRPHTVIGVTAQGFTGLSVVITPDVWLPLGMYALAAAPFSDNAAVTDLGNPANFALNISARMKPGLTLEAARAALPVLDARLNAENAAPGAEPRALQITKPSRLSLSSGPTDDGPVELVGLLLSGMAGIVLLIASLNLANLLLARGAARAREVAVRLAVGATRWQIVRQLTVEGLILALIGGAFGLVLSDWTNAVLKSSFESRLTELSFSFSAELHPDVRVVLATFGFCLAATLVFSVGPAWRAARADLVHDLKSQGGEPAVTGRFNRFFAGRHLLVMAQMALSLVLVFASGLFLRAALNASGADRGFNSDGVLVASLDYSIAGTPKAEGIRRVDDLVTRARSLPGVRAAGVTSLVPFGNISSSTRVVPGNTPATRGPDEPDPGVNASIASVTSGYFDSITVPVLRGRDFTDLEAGATGSPVVAIVDETLATKLFPDGDALGRQIRYTDAPADGSPAEMTIVGIVDRHRLSIEDEEAANYRLYVPFAQRYNASSFLFVRNASGDHAATLGSIPGLRSQLRAIDPDVPLLQIQPFREIVAKNLSVWVVQLGAVLFGVFGGIALAIATVGVYGVKAYTVERRRRELGIRLALGATRTDVFTLIMRQGILQTLVASAAGVALALLVGQALATMLYRVSPSDPLALAAAVGLLTASSLLACWIPARRATRVNPCSALRAE